MGGSMSLRAYRIMTVEGFGGALSHLLVQLSDDGLSERILPLSYRTAGEAENVKMALEHADAAEARLSAGAEMVAQPVG